MIQFIGEYDCKIDPKGRVMIPAGLKKQLPEEAADKFVINRGFEKCLVLYPYNEWQKISAEVNKLNLYNQKNRNFARYFFRGATELSLDANGRILLPKSLLEYAGITNDLVLFPYSNRIEVWSKDAYDNLLNEEPEDFAMLAEEVMGGAIGERSEDELS
ncbi:division/cell wall cluster transcriptional repressor MraZ [Solitalea canadensis]|uniref:Transcriptional regulator MraZ n=1 Tax=Solitalea canadensis (strain ATCC 29591 / DSM 3403 / JCM 21819 / LMG 8368 / NBRC 15130 / NCIMB 12057 / USAM 9D) TaxID=929556 RepID=H8KRZ0_SOLCM|nr:division/cell wall cluster transcriptional repressor MraZ [Solitalea canadensis]AFD07778.1 mraZ protein [Solitalea canadensis DSM 3403]